MLCMRRRAGCNAFRISIEWSRIVPVRGRIDYEAVRHYHRIFDKIDECALPLPLVPHGESTADPNVLCRTIITRRRTSCPFTVVSQTIKLG